MLVRITERCKMGCTHCMINASPSGMHMSMETYGLVVDFIKDNNFMVIMLSGGEPTEHPDLLQMIDIAKQKGLYVLLLSNGMFLESDKYTTEILSKNILIQVTNDERFYPHRIKKIEHPNISYEDHIRMVSPFGRSLENKLECSRQSPMCFNLRSATRKFHNFGEAVRYLRTIPKMCIPSINPDGSLSAGEANSCSKFGFVTDSMERLTSNLCTMRCNKCGLVDKLDPLYKSAINEL
jgi:organic radical activating enzyme